MDTSTMTDELSKIELSLQLSMESLAEMLIFKSQFDGDLHSADYKGIQDCFNDFTRLKNDIVELERSIGDESTKSR